MKRSKKAWAIVHKSGRIEVDTISTLKQQVKDQVNLMDEKQGAKVRRVIVTLAE